MKDDAALLQEEQGTIITDEQIRSRKRRLSGTSWLMIALLFVGLAFSRIDTPSPKTLLLPLRSEAGDSKVIKDVLDLLRDKGLTSRTYDELYFSGKAKHQNQPTLFLLYWPLAYVSQATFANILDLLFRLCVLFAAWASVRIFELAWEQCSPRKESPWRTRYDKIAGRTVLFILFLFFYPLQLGVHQLQAQNIIIAIFTMVMYLEVRSRGEVRSGMLMGIATAVKPQYGVYALWALMKKRRGLAAGLVGIAGLLILVSVLMFGIDSSTTFYLKVLPDLSKRGEAYFPNQSVNGMLNRILTTGMNADFSYTSYPPINPIVVWGTRISGILLIALGLFTKNSPRKDGVGRALDLGFVGLAFTMAGTIAWEHYYAILVPIVAVMVPMMVFSHDRRRWMVPTFVIGYLLIGFRWWQTRAFADQGLLTLLQSPMFFGGILFLLLLHFLRKQPLAEGDSP